jgi:hypothetical protein
MLVVFALLLCAASSAQDAFAEGDLLLIHGWLPPCRDRLRLAEVVRVERGSHDLLQLGGFDVIGREAQSLARDLMERLAKRMGSAAPLLIVERRAAEHWSASAEEEA